MGRKKIAVLMASIDREYQQKFAAGLAAAGLQYGIDICIFNSQGHMNIEFSTSDTGESIVYDLPDLNDFEGIISMPATMGNDITLKKLYDVLGRVKGKPHISIDVPQDGAVTVTFDDQGSVEELTEHLINKHGARKFAYISGPLDSEVAAGRLKACRRTLERHGLTLDDSLVFDGQWTRVGGQIAVKKLMDMDGDLPDTIMCGNDDMALSTIEYLFRHGVRVPDDIMVTGFDALQEAVMRGMTTIRRPIEESARKAIEILKAWIEGEEPREKNVILSTELVFGSSCGCVQDMAHINANLYALVSEKWDSAEKLIRISMLSGTMAGIGSVTEAHEKFQDFISALDIDEFYVSVDPAICRETDAADKSFSFPQEMLLLYGVRKGKHYDSVILPKNALVPVLQQERDEPVCLVFCPLYYRDRSLGYVAMGFGNGTNSTLYTVLMLLNGALLSLFMQTNNRRSASMIERMAVHDIMTGLLNRRGYMKQAPVLLEQARREGKVFVLLSADMNRMKYINDQYGHLAGDEAICRMGRALRCLTRYGMTPVHISGDEFLAYGITGRADEAAGLVKTVKDEMERMNREDPWLCNITAGVGVYAAVPRAEDNIDIFMTQADQAMYDDKNKRKYGRRKDDIV